jgi:hypothetical protein
MTAAERQAKRRERLWKEAELARRRDGPRRPGEDTPPVHGYPQAKQKMLAEGHTFERCRREWGFEEGVFVDGAFVNSGEVVHPATLPKTEREKALAENRHRNKDFACMAIRSYMDAMRVSRDELVQYLDRSAASLAQPALLTSRAFLG